MTMKVCPICKRTASRDTANFCFNDGTKMEPVQVCECGNPLMPGIEKFCEKCGKRVEVKP